MGESGPNSPPAAIAEAVEDAFGGGIEINTPAYRNRCRSRERQFR